MGSQGQVSMDAAIERTPVDLTPVKESLIPIIWVIGGPGSGRTTQCEYLQARHGWAHLSTGTLLREEVMSGSKRGQQLFSVMQSGQLAPHEVVLDILAQKMVEKVVGSTGFGGGKCFRQANCPCHKDCSPQTGCKCDAGK